MPRTSARRLPLALTCVVAMLVAGAAPLAPARAASAALPVPADGGPAELLRYVGDNSSATGNALSNAASCDVNGDGVDDAVVGAWFWDKTQTNIGAAYVLLGGTSVRGGSLGNPAAAGAVRIDGPDAAENKNATVGFAVGCLGDVNGDGLDDIAISHYTAQKVYVLFGRRDFSPMGLDAVGDRGFVVKTNPTTGGNLGFSLSPVGDLNHDGLDDFAVAEIVADTRGRTNNGRVWVIAGRSGISDVDLSAPSAGQVLFTADGARNEERLGQAAAAGDVNGDGVDDLLLGSYTATPWGTSVAVPGAAYVVFGSDQPTEVDLLSLGTAGFTVAGPQRGRDRLGVSVAAAGDLNKDGRADLLVGADGVSQTGALRNGGAAVVYGSAATETVYTDPSAATGAQTVYTCASGEVAPSCVTRAARGYWINGAAPSDSTGYSVAGVGDVNGDEVPDFVIGAWGFDPVDPTSTASPPTTMSNAGGAYVVYGRGDTTRQELSGLSAADGWRIDGLRAGDRLGRQVGRVGDFDANGRADLMASGDFAGRPLTSPGTQNGEVVVALLGRLTSSTTLSAPAAAEPGQEVTLTATVSKPAGDQTAISAGTVDFTADGTTIPGCGAVQVSTGSAACTTTFGVRGTRAIRAGYSGTATTAPSSGADSSLAVGSVSALRVDPPAAASYGTPGSLTGGVSGNGTTATGTVSLREGATELATVELAQGEYRFALPAGLAAGSHDLSVDYAGDDRHDPASATAAIRVERATPTIDTQLSKHRIKARKGRVVVGVQVTAPGGPVTGPVSVRIGARPARTVELVAGYAEVRLPKVRTRGVRTVHVTYLGSPNVAPAAAVPVQVRVR